MESCLIQAPHSLLEDLVLPTEIHGLNVFFLRLNYNSLSYMDIFYFDANIHVLQLFVSKLHCNGHLVFFFIFLGILFSL